MRQGRRIFTVPSYTVAFFLLFTVAGRQRLEAQPINASPEMLADAALHDVFFLDADRGWAVGDRGVIWSSEDGGRHWRLADSPVNCSLRAIHFIDEQNGWIVGGWTHPYSHRTSGVVLRTENGGRRWTQVPSKTLPQLTRVKFFDQRHGWAIGLSSAMYSAGIFRTEDGGRSWASYAVDQQSQWLAGDFTSPEHGVVVGRGGHTAVVGTAAIQRLGKPKTGLRQLHAVKSIDSARTMVAGDGGLLLVTQDAGHSWNSPELPIPNSNKLDFRTIEMLGDTCWIAGKPGSCILRSRDAGRSWEISYTGQSLPIQSIKFVDQQRGWAVGALGTILATRDGGETWHAQRRGGERAALLGMFAESHDVPLEVLSRYCGDEGYIGVVETLTRRDVEVNEATYQNQEGRLVAGVLAAGGAYATSTWRLPLRQAGLKMNAAMINQGWSIVNGEDATRVLDEHLVLRLRQWRPDVVLTGGTSARNQDPLTQLTSQAVVRAAELAADPTAFSDHIQILGLEPWQVKKVCSVTNGDAPAAITIDTSQLATRLGSSIKQHAMYGYSLMQDRWHVVPRRRGIQVLTSAVPPTVASRDLFSGVVLAYGSEARRVEGHAQATSLGELRTATQKQRVVDSLLIRAATDAKDLASWSAQIDELTRELSPQAGGDILYQLAQHYREIGRYELACESLQFLIRKYPTHSLSDAAIVWYIEYLASEEAAVAFGLQPALASHLVQRASHTETFNAALPPNAPRKLQVSRYDSRAQQAGFDASLEVDHPLDRLLHQTEQLHHARPALFAEPQIRFAIAAAYRKQGLVSTANRYYQQIAASQPFNGWRQTAHGELWLTARKGHSPKPLLSCRRVAEPPYLDGKLDDAIWSTVEAVELKSQLGDDQSWPTIVKLARGDEHLFVSIQCQKVDGVEYPVASEERSYDRDLSDRDRVELLIDTNRDYTSFIKLSVDHRGWTGEAAWGDARWNPEWFVAESSDDATWTIEAAIPLSELSSEPVADGDAWACGLQRIVPQVGFQSWTQPASVAGLPEGFGLLSFD